LSKKSSVATAVRTALLNKAAVFQFFDEAIVVEIVRIGAGSFRMVGDTQNSADIVIGKIRNAREKFREKSRRLKEFQLHPF
jgi:hypothetical protein